jgi:peroxiredoxin
VSRQPTLVDIRKIIAGLLVAAVTMALVIQFMRMIEPAAAREVQAACRGLRASPTNSMIGALPAAAPDFALKNHLGETVRLSDFRGKKVLINFWASWCGVCETEKPSLMAMTRTLAGDDFVVLTVAGDSEWEPIKAKLPNGAPFQVLLDPPPPDQNLGPTARAYGIKAVPESFLVDEHGNVTHYFINKRDWDSDVAQTCLRAVLDDVEI